MAELHEYIDTYCRTVSTALALAVSDINLLSVTLSEKATKQLSQTAKVIFYRRPLQIQHQANSVSRPLQSTLAVV